MKRAVNQSTALSFRWTLRPWQESLLIAKSATLSVWRHFSLEDACPADRVDMATIQTIAPSGWTWKISKNFIHFWKLRSSKSLQFDSLELWFNWIKIFFDWQSVPWPWWSTERTPDRTCRPGLRWPEIRRSTTSGTRTFRASSTASTWATIRSTAPFRTKSTLTATVDTTDFTPVSLTSVR